ncbi:PAS domain-containing protein [Vulcaniibacterium tengchongense]|uniref:histidine kinase n=1 Tax=Vulcaniibacterium tengchongense TaxID=1273429 RepID=A0A3N4W1Q4_9GAMM|nr:PAS domain-containing protein [Vulcaniibacterium tengchongense]RPE79980.1 PAS domain-containing protein [Vulcaniibacterium tengchongense]
MPPSAEIPGLAGQLYRTMLDRLPVGAYACDTDGLITYYNLKAVELWGRAPKLCHPDYRFCGSYRLYATDGSPLEHHRSSMALALSQGREYLGQELLVERPDATLVPTLTYASPLLDENGEVVAGINMLVNISERKRFERLLRDVNETKNLYMATLADELRTQLAALRRALGKIERMVDPLAPRPAALDELDGRMREMGSLIEDLLEVPQARMLREAQEPAV